MPTTFHQSVHSLIREFDNCSARALGFEPRSKVLETSILPLNYARKKKLSESQELSESPAKITKYPDNRLSTLQI